MFFYDPLIYLIFCVPFFLLTPFSSLFLWKCAWIFTDVRSLLLNQPKIMLVLVLKQTSFVSHERLIWFLLRLHHWRQIWNFFIVLFFINIKEGFVFICWGCCWFWHLRCKDHFVWLLSIQFFRAPRCSELIVFTDNFKQGLLLNDACKAIFG